MKIKSILIIAYTMVAFSAWAQQANITSKEAYLNHLEMLYEEGRHNYADIGNQVQLLRIIEAYQSALTQGQQDGTLTQHDIDSMLLLIKECKLLGDYHYLHTDNSTDSYAIAEAHYKNALAYAEDTAYRHYPDIYYYQFVLHQELGQLYYKQGRYDEAHRQMEAAKRRANYLADDDLLDFLAQSAMCKARVKKFDSALQEIELVIENYNNTDTERYGEAIRKKAKILMLQKENKGTGSVSPTDEAVKCYKEYYTLKKDDAMKRLGAMDPEEREQYWMRIRPFVVDCYRIEDADPGFLYDVTLFGKALLLEYARKGNPEFCTWKDVQKKLKTGESAVEFIQYEKKGEKRMAALVLKKKGEPQFVQIGSVESLLNEPLVDGGILYGAITLENHKMKNQLYNDSTVYVKIWTPDLLNAIGNDTEKLYFAPDGIFHILAIEYMIPDEPQLTSLKTENLYRLTSTRQLLAKDIKTRGQKMLLCGGISYSRKPTEPRQTAKTDFTNDEQAYLLVKELTKGLSPYQEIWSKLPGAQKEIDSIQAMYGTKRTTVLSGTEAAELKVANMMAEYPIVHLSTHGYFGGTVPVGTDILPANYDGSLSDNLIVLSGANVSLRNDDFDGSQHDGMFSAREIMQMDYSRIELIVLSACQTGLGYVTDDGIYGLQRGLKNAGVKGMIVSLWSVNDEATTRLMQSFYNHLQSEDAHTAFMHARQELITTSRKSEKFFDPVKMKTVDSPFDYNEPCYYDAFILIDVK